MISNSVWLDPGSRAGRSEPRVGAVSVIAAESWMAAIRIGLVSLLCSKVRSISPRQGSSLCALLSNRSPPLLSSLSAAGLRCLPATVSPASSNYDWSMRAFAFYTLVRRKKSLCNNSFLPIAFLSTLRRLNFTVTMDSNSLGV